MSPDTVKRIVFSAVLLGASSLSAGDKDKPADKLETKVVDSGSFGIYVEGKRVGTETFKIEQRPEFSIASATLKVDDGKTKAEQTAEMRVSPKGELRSYTWRATQPQAEQASVEPRNELLVEHLVPADQKKMDVPHSLPVSTVILDNNFFSQREILLWRYLATGCVWKEGQGRLCKPGSFVILVPRLHATRNATLEIVGVERTTVKGVERELNKISLQTGGPNKLVELNEPKEEPGQWLLWVDDQYKVVKMTVPGSNIEVLRD
ncbi:MAG TPA: hypothetical protein VKD24_09365 [Candidatus Angelobacter sp.]|nr:hypothetical protein [Candidatus Angelobacter sp.]